MKTKLLIFICLLAAAASVNAQFFVPTSGAQNVTTCGGTFYDSQLDPGANYSNNVNGQMISCPSVAGQYVSLTFTSMVLADNTDILRIYSGTGTGGPLLQSWQGPLNTSSFCAAVVSQDVSGGCLTAHFQTGSNGIASGWNAMLSCNPTPSVTPVGTNCANPVVIPSVPFLDSAQCTQCMINDYTNQAGICNTTYNGEDRVYRYNTSGPETDCITMSNTSGNPALAIYQGCPGAGGVCLTPTPMVGNNTMVFTFPSAATYYIIIDEASGYSCYDLSITPCAIGIDEANTGSIENISIIQNPLTGQITFRWKSEVASTISVIDCLGRLMFTANTNDGVASFNTASWARGIYFVKVKGAKEERVAKFVKQ